MVKLPNIAIAIFIDLSLYAHIILYNILKKRLKKKQRDQYKNEANWLNVREAKREIWKSDSNKIANKIKRESANTILFVIKE